MTHPNEQQSKNDNDDHIQQQQQQQQLIHAALDSALDELDSDNEIDDEENETFSDCISNEHEILNIHPNEQHPPQLTNVNTTTTQPVMGPPKPPPNSIPAVDDPTNMDQLFASMMGQLMNMSNIDENGNCIQSDNSNNKNETNPCNFDPLLSNAMNDDEVLGRFMQEIQSRLQSELSVAAAAEVTSNSITSNSTNHTAKQIPTTNPTTPTTTKSSTPSTTQTTPPPPPSSQPRPAESNNNNSNSEIESVISNLVQNLSQTMNRSMNSSDDIDDDDISELDDLPDRMDDMGNPNDDNMALLLQKLMGSLHNVQHTTDQSATNSNTKNKNNDATTTRMDNDFNTDTILDGMMEQLLCKDIMYEPMKQVALQFPDWLQQQQSILSTTEYER